MTVQTASDQMPAASFPAGYHPLGGAHDELYARDGTLRPQWEYIMRSLGSLGAEEFGRRGGEARRLLRESGVTYNIYDDPQRPERPWPLDLLPVLVTSAEWQTIEQALIQRAELLELILADLYGARRLIRTGLLPPELVYGHPGFLHSCAGVPAPGGRQLPLYAADLARAPDGDLIVLGDRTQAPSGAGYALENRVVLSRVLPSIVRDSHLHRLPLFFRRLREMLARFAPRQDDPPSIVLLTPGPGNETYFEHSFLASRLGFMLAQGDDLTVRDQRLWLRTLDGLKPVDVLLRRVDGVFCDPLELRADSLLGTPGLLQAARHGTVAIVNPLGSSAVENPGLMAFLPALARQLLGEDLKLPSVRTWWCGDAEGRAYVIEHLGELVVKPVFSHPSRFTVFGAALDAAARQQLTERIRAQPHLFVGQEQIALSTAPVLIGAQLEPRAMVLRAFLAAENDGYIVMPGGLCRVAPTRQSALVSNQVGGVSKDVWVLASEPERETALLLPADQRPLLVRGGQAVPGRVADNLFWVGRYAERAEAAGRVLRAVLQHILDSEEDTDDRHLPALLAALTRVTATYPGFVGAGAAERIADRERELLAVLLDTRRAGSLRYDLSALVRAARAVRDRLSADTWRVINSLDRELAADGDLRHALAELERVLLMLAAFGGLTADSMSRGQGWHFLEIGRRLERALGMVITVQALSPLNDARGTPWDDLLGIADASMTHRRRYRATAEAGPVLDLLLDDETNPRSVVHQLLRLDALLSGLSIRGTTPQRTAEQRLVADALDELRRTGGASGEAPRQPGADLDNLLQRIAAQLATLSDQLMQTYFSRPDRPQQLVALGR
ncbi:MAG TPA: circularly permuted type 2 ATP-grasp protein [Candidatus Acidoferrales bacterium]|nr:circularly permuted type 2 ATP-grasp protein [Candidatus Acidoferrales bacterium]